MAYKLPLSVVLLTQNEEQNIRDCLSSISDWADEILVIDSGSTDRTLTIAAEFTDRIYHHPFENYSVQRNWAQDNLQIRNEWIFHLDADERATPGLMKRLAEFLKDGDRSGDIAGLLVRRRIEFLGRHIRHGGLYPTYHCRIFRKDQGHCEARAYDQHFVVEGSLEVVPEDLVEVTASSLESWTARHNRWAQLEAQYLVNKERQKIQEELEPSPFGSPIQRRRWLRVSILEKTPLFLRSLFYFLYRYFLRFGFLDGREGLIYHVLHGFWFRFYVDSCIFEIKQQNNSLEGVP